MTNVYITNCTALMNEDALVSVLPLLTPSRRDRVQTLKAMEKKAQTATAGLLLRYRFGPSHSIVFSEYGKPYLADPSAYFSLSHSAQWVALAVSDRAIGFDIQALSPIRPSVLRRYFTEEEQAYIGKEDTRFTEIWTQREAYTKYVGSRMTTAVRPDTSLPHCSGQYENTRYTLYGDDELIIHLINVKDLL